MTNNKKSNEVERILKYNREMIKIQQYEKRQQKQDRDLNNLIIKEIVDIITSINNPILGISGEGDVEPLELIVNILERLNIPYFILNTKEKSFKQCLISSREVLIFNNFNINDYSKEELLELIKYRGRKIVEKKNQKTNIIYKTGIIIVGKAPLWLNNGIVDSERKSHILKNIHLIELTQKRKFELI